MTIEINERVADMLPHADNDALDAAAAQFGSWIADQAAAVRGMGPTVRIDAHLSLTRCGRNTCLECSFQNRRGELYTVTVTTGRKHWLVGRSASAVDETAAMVALGTLLEELGMRVSLQ